MSAPRRWVGEHRIEVDTTLALRLGPLGLWLSRQPREWTVVTSAGDDSLDPRLACTTVGPGWEPPEQAVVHRFAGGLDDTLVRLDPQLADRPIVVRPQPSLRIVPSGHAVLFVSTPIWLRISLTGPARSLLEVPTWRPSDTWFGADTRRGRLCYAGRTLARLSFENVPLRPHRAITRITVANHAADAFEVERLAIPTPHLSLFQDSGGSFWTQGVTASRGRAGSFDGVDLDEDPPPEATGATKVASAREAGTPTVFQRAWQALLG